MKRGSWDYAILEALLILPYNNTAHNNEPQSWSLHTVCVCVCLLQHSKLVLRVQHPRHRYEVSPHSGSSFTPRRVQACSPTSWQPEHWSAEILFS